MSDTLVRLKYEYDRMSRLATQRTTETVKLEAEVARLKAEVARLNAKLKEGRGPIISWLTNEMNKVRPLEAEIKRLRAALEGADDGS